MLISSFYESLLRFTRRAGRYAIGIMKIEINKLFKSVGCSFVILLPVIVFPAYAGCEIEQTNSDDYTVSSETTGLMWSRCLFGQSGKRCESGSASKMIWVDAVNKARGSELANYKNWRLPRIEEIETLLTNCSDRQLLFPGLVDGFIWSASANLDFNTKAWAFNLRENNREVFSRDSERSYLHFILVRNIK